MTEPRIFDPNTTHIDSYYKVFDYRKRTLSNAIIENFDLNTSYMFVEARGVKGLTIRNNKVRLKQPQTGGNIPFGVIFRTGEDNVVEGNVFENFQMVDAGGYTNGDCACEERPVKRTRWSNNIFRAASDGGLDTKGIDTFIEHNVSEGNYRNYRLWGNGRMDGNTSRNPRGAHIWMTLGHQAAGNWEIKDQQFFDDGSKTHIQIDGGKAGVVVTIIDPVVNGVKVTDLSQLRIKKATSAKPVEVRLVISPAAKTVLSKTKLKDGNKDGVIIVTTSSVAADLGVELNTKLDAKSEKAEAGGWRYTVL